MFLSLPKRIIAFLFTALVVVPMFFFLPFVYGSSVKIAQAQTAEEITNAGLLGLGGSGSPSGGVGCGVLWWRCIVKDLVEFLLVSIPKFFFGLAGIVFDTMIAFSLSSTIIKNQAFVDKGWVIMRDLSNTFFIFILLYIAIATILQTAGGQTKRLLATLVMVALLMNFSLYITRFVIDIGNVFALEFYTNMGVEGLSYVNLGPNDIQPRSIAAAFKNSFDLEILLGPDFITATGMNVPEATFVFLLVGIMYLVATFVFLTAGFLFLARVVAFWFLMIISPLAFFSMILPFTRGKVWGPWSSQLVSQSFFAPIFLFFVYLTLMLAGTVNTLFVAGNPLNGNMGFLQTVFITFLTFFALIFTLLAGLKAAKSMSGGIGDAMTRIGGTVTGAVAVGGAAAAGRNTFGRGARYLEDKFGGKLDESRAGRFMKSQLNTVASSSFDARASKLGQIVQSTVGGVNLGQAGGKGGHVSSVAEKQKDLTEHTKKLMQRDPAAAASYLATHELTGDRDTAAAMASLSSAQRAELIAKAKPGKEQDRLKRINESLGGGLTPRQQRAEQKGIKEYEKTAKKEAREIEQETRVADLKTIQSKFAEAKNAAEKDTAKAEAKELLNQMKGEEIADLGGELLSSDIVAHHLSDKDLEQIERKSNLTKGHQEALYANVKANGTQEAKDYLNLSPAVKRKNASKNRKVGAQEAEENLKRELKEAENEKGAAAEPVKEVSEPDSGNKA